MKKYFIVLSFVLVALMLSSSVYALSLLTEDSKNTVCIGSTTTIVDKVSGASGKSIVEASGDATSFTTTVPTEFTGESQNIYSYITLSSKTKPGTYYLNIKVTSGNVSKTQSHEIVAKDCHGTSLTVDSEKKICPCEKIKYSLVLDNQGEFTENFKISVDGTAKKWANLSVSSIELKSGKSNEFYANVETPCDAEGTYTLTFKAVAEASLAGATASSKIQILPCYEYNLKASKNYSLCENEALKIPVTIENKGTAGNTFEIILNGPTWAKLSDKSVDADSDSSEIFNIEVQPPFKTKGSFNLTVETMTSAGSVKKDVTTNIDVRRCYGVSLDLQKEDQLCKKEKEYTVLLTNLGEFDSKYNLNIEGPEWAKLSDNSVNVDAKENKTVTIEVEPKDAEFGKYNIKVTATDSESGDNDSKTLKLEIPNLEECYKPELTSSEDSMSLELEKSKTLFIMIKNNGLDDSLYRIKLDGKASKFSIINPNEVELKAGSSETLYLYVSPPLFTDLGEYNLTIIAQEKNSEVKSEKVITINLVEEGQANANDTKAENIKQPNILMKAIGAIRDFFTKIFMVKSVNETILEDTRINLSKIADSNDSLIENVTLESNESVVEEAEISEIEEDVNATELSEDIEVNDTISEIESDEAVSDDTISENITELADREDSDVNETEDLSDDVEVNESDDTITITADAIESEETENESEKITDIKEFNEKADNFFNTYKTYLIGAAGIVLIILLILSGAGKAIVEFFEEDEKPKKK